MSKKEQPKIDLKAMKTTELIDLGNSAPDLFWDAGGQGVDWWDEIRSRVPFEQIEDEKLEQDDLEEARKDIMVSVRALQDRIDELWKALRTHHHAEGKVVREV